MKKIYRKNKKGLSEMVSYVLLVIIAVGLSALVFAYLKVYVPKDKAECNSDISIILEKYSCVLDSNGNAELNLSFLNKGLFKIDGAYVRFGSVDKSVKQLVNDPNTAGMSIHKFYLSKGPEEIVTSIENRNPTGLKPGESSQRSYEVDSSLLGQGNEYSIEIQPAVISEGDILACSSAVVTQTINCN